MNCNDFENLIIDYLEDTIPAPLRRQMESHLFECKKCSTLADQEKEVMEQLIKLELESCPDEILDYVMESISLPQKSFKERILKWFKPSHPWRYGFASVAGSIAVVLIALFIYVPRQHRKTTVDIVYTSAEIQQAKVDARLALAYFSVYSKKTESAFNKIDLANPLIKPLEQGLKKAIDKIPYI
jgi:hypothetical protein